MSPGKILSFIKEQFKCSFLGDIYHPFPADISMNMALSFVFGSKLIKNKKMIHSTYSSMSTYRLIETESKMVVLKSWRVRQMGRCLVKGYKLPVITLVSSGDSAYNIVIIINSTVLLT